MSTLLKNFTDMEDSKKHNSNIENITKDVEYTYLWQDLEKELDDQALTLILGDAGSGKSFWYNRLNKKIKLAEHIDCIHNINLRFLLKKFSLLYNTPVPLGPVSIEEIIILIMPTLLNLKNAHLLIDNAELLDIEVIEFLFKLSSSLKTNNNLKIILFSYEGIKEHIPLEQKNHYQEIYLRPMNLQELRLFIKNNYNLDGNLNENLLQGIMHSSLGWPKQAIKMIHECWNNLIFSEVYAVIKAKKKPFFTLKKIISSLYILILILTIISLALINYKYAIYLGFKI